MIGAELDLEALDAAARRRACTVFDRPLAVEAGAGTGKTTLLVCRVVGWALGPGWHRHADQPEPARRAERVLERVVAITFTEAAAAEMAERIGRELAGLASGGPPSELLAGVVPEDPAELRSRARHLLGALDRLTVRTIHAWCRSLLAAHPLVLGLHPELTVDADGTLLETAAHEAVERALAVAARPEVGDLPPLVELLVDGRSGDDLVAAVEELVASGIPAEVLDGDPFSGPRMAALHAEVAAAVGTLAELTRPLATGPRGQLGPQVHDALVQARLALVGPVPNGVGAAAVLAERLAALVPEKFRDRLEKWGTGNFTGTEERLLGAVTSALPAVALAASGPLGALCDLDPVRFDRARRALGPLVAEVRRDLRRRGVVTFDDLLRHARTLVLDHPDVADRIRADLDQLLVDELQDTDSRQCDLVVRIGLGRLPAGARHLATGGDDRGYGNALDEPVVAAAGASHLFDVPVARVGDVSEPGARHLSDGPTLFAVGDPKQSIYGWRDADLAAWESLVDGVVAAGGELLQLARTFRCGPRLVAEVERVVAPVMRAERGLQPAFARLVAARADAAEPPREDDWPREAVEYWIPREPDSPDAVPRTDRAAAIEAAAIADDVARLCARGACRPSDVAILLRSLGDVEHYLQALRSRGIPFTVGRDRSYYRRREVIDAGALVRVVLDPGDLVALVTLLRSPVVGVPDAALLPLWRAGFPARLAALGGPGEPSLDETGPSPVAALDASRESALNATLAAVREAAAATPTDVPGIARVAGWEASLAVAVERLAALRRLARTAPADTLVEALRDAFLSESTEAARYLGPYRVANLGRFFDELADVLAEMPDTTALLRHLRRTVAEARERPEELPAEGREDAVQVATIHGAKGLEFGHVYVAQVGKQPAADRGDGTAAAELGDAWSLCLFGSAAPDWWAVRTRRERVAAAEGVRTLYVAMTRARERLVVLGHWPSRTVAAAAAEPRSHLDLVMQRPEVPVLGDLAKRPGRWLRDTTWALWRIVSADPDAVGAAGEDGERPPVDVPALVAGAEILAARRAVASSHAKRLFGGAATALAHAGAAWLPDADRVASTVLDADGELEREAAQRVGTALHRALEALELDLPPLFWHDALQRAAMGELARLQPPGEPVPTAASARLARLLGSRLLARLSTVAPRVLARELPLLLPPEPRGPVGYVSGAVDLLIAEDDGSVTIVDYKTEPLATGTDATTAAAPHRAQLALYARGLAAAWNLPSPPRCELWFLAADRVVALLPDGRVVDA